MIDMLGDLCHTRLVALPSCASEGAARSQYPAVGKKREWLMTM